MSDKMLTDAELDREIDQVYDAVVPINSDKHLIGYPLWRMLARSFYAAGAAAAIDALVKERDEDTKLIRDLLATNVQLDDEWRERLSQMAERADRRVKELTPEQEQRLLHTLPVWARKRLNRMQIMATAHASNYCREKDRADRAEAALSEATKDAERLLELLVEAREWFHPHDPKVPDALMDMCQRIDVAIDAARSKP